MRRRLVAAAIAVLFALAVAASLPSALGAECTDLGGNGTLCTTGDPASGSFGAGLHADPVNLCVVIFATCPY